MASNSEPFETMETLNLVREYASENETPSTSPMASKCSDRLDMSDIVNRDLTLLTLHRPTYLKKLMDSVPRPPQAVPKDGLPIWHKLDIDWKLYVPKMPKGKVMFCRGKIGEDIRRVRTPRGEMDSIIKAPSFDLSDPYGHYVSYEYVPMHDRHLAKYFAQKPARDMMKKLGYCTSDGRAVCTLKEFNSFRKFLYKIFQDRVHKVLAKVDEQARDSLTLKKVEDDVARRAILFQRAEKAREQMERYARQHSDEVAERKRAGKIQQQKIQARLKHLAEYKENLRKENAIKAAERHNSYKRRVAQAEELELRRKIMMVRMWRQAEDRRSERLRNEFEQRKIRKEKEAEEKWQKRVQSQIRKIQEEAFLLKIYSEDMRAATNMRLRRAETYAYKTDLNLQRIRLKNLKLVRGAEEKHRSLIRKMGVAFEKTKRGVKGLTLKKVMVMAHVAMKQTYSTKGDQAMMLGNARKMMDVWTLLPKPPLQMLDTILENTIKEFSRGHVNTVLRDIERSVGTKVFKKLMTTRRLETKSLRKARLMKTKLTQQSTTKRRFATVAFGIVEEIPRKDAMPLEVTVLKRSKDRPPSPVPSLTKLAEAVFVDKLEDLPENTVLSTNMPERTKLINNIKTASEVINRAVTRKVHDSIDIVLLEVTFPRLRHAMEWGEAVETVEEAIVDDRVTASCENLRRAADFLTHRVLVTLNIQLREEKRRREMSAKDLTDEGDFYVPDEVPKMEFYVPGLLRVLDKEDQ